MLTIDKEKIKKILIIKFGGMGDLLLTTPILPNLRFYFPKAEIYYFTLRNAKDILVDNPYIDRVITYDPNEDKSWCLLKNIRKQKYDLVIDLFCNPRTALITFISGARYRFGFAFRGRKYAYNIKARGRGGEVHNVEFNLDALRRLDIPIVSKYLSIDVNIVHDEFADAFINEKKLGTNNLIGVALTGGWEAKKYKTADYIELIKKIKDIYDVNVLLFWGNKTEKEECEKVNLALPEFTFMIPDSPIRYLGALLKKCRLLICNDSGPMHIAVALGIPVLSFYGPTNPALQGPYGEKHIAVVNEGLECLYCNLLDCPIGNICMTQMSKVLILEKFKELLSKNNISF